ncbi:thioredoxin-like domain-containing protein [Xylariaceae sp. FL0662B]|nr:thioredoxin-like domain-containing protein [Xylariaceae sp. FL0662B]
MKFRSSKFFTSLLAGTALAWTYTDEQEFRRAISGHNRALVAFVEPSTAASQALETEWISIAEAEKSLISINCASEAGLCHEYGVISYPALRFFDGHGKMVPYRGPRKASAILSYMKRAARPAVSKFDKKKPTTFQSVDDYVLIANVNPQDEHVENAYKSLASQYRDRASFGLVDTAGTTTIACYKNKDQQQLTISDLSAIDLLPKFVETCITPLIGEFTRANEMNFLQAGKSLVFYFATASKDREAYVDAMRPVAKMYKEYLNFVTVDANEYADLATMLGLTSGSFPALAVQNPMFGQVFPYSQRAKITPETVGAFVMDIVQGKVKPWDGTNQGGNGHSRDEL